MADDEGTSYGLMVEPTPEVIEALRAIQKQRAANPAKAAREDADNTALYDRYGRAWPNGEKQEKLLQAAREYAAAELDTILAAREHQTIDDLDMLRRQITHAAWLHCAIDQAVRDTPKWFFLNFSEFSDAIWKESWPSLEDRATEAFSKNPKAPVIVMPGQASPDTIQAALSRGDRKAAVQLWQIQNPGKSKRALYEAANQDKAEYYRWERGELPNGCQADRDICGKLIRP